MGRHLRQRRQHPPSSRRHLSFYTPINLPLSTPAYSTTTPNNRRPRMWHRPQYPPSTRPSLEPATTIRHNPRHRRLIRHARPRPHKVLCPPLPAPTRSSLSDPRPPSLRTRHLHPQMRTGISPQHRRRSNQHARPRTHPSIHILRFPAHAVTRRRHGAGHEYAS